MDPEQVKLDMFQLIPGQEKKRERERKGWRRDGLEREKYGALMSSTKHSPKSLEDT